MCVSNTSPGIDLNKPIVAVDNFSRPRSLYFIQADRQGRAWQQQHWYLALLSTTSSIVYSFRKCARITIYYTRGQVQRRVVVGANVLISSNLSSRYTGPGLDEWHFVNSPIVLLLYDLPTTVYVQYEFCTRPLIIAQWVIPLSGWCIPRLVDIIS